MDITFFSFVSAFWSFQGGSCLHAPWKPCNDCARWDMCFLFLSGMLYPCTYGRNQKLGEQTLYTPSCHTSCFQSIVLEKSSFKPRCCNCFLHCNMFWSFSFLILHLRDMEMSFSPAEYMQDCHTRWLPFVYTPLCQYKHQNTMRLRQTSYIRDRYLCVIIQNSSRGMNYIVKKIKINST